MRMHGQGPRRGQPYNNRGGQRPPHGSLESTGPGGRLRGNAQQLADRYTTLGREAITQREFLEAEGFFQYAEHYKRLAAGQKKHHEHRAQATPQRSADSNTSESQKPDQDLDTASFSATEAMETLPTFVVNKAETSGERDTGATEDAQNTKEEGTVKAKPRAKVARTRAPRKKPLKKEEKSETLTEGGAE